MQEFTYGIIIGFGMGVVSVILDSYICMILKMRKGD